MSKKKILVGGLSLAIVGISCLAIGSKPIYKTIDNSNLDERMAVYIKNETGNYEKSNSIPTTGYILNEEKSTCNNNAKPTWNRNNKSLKISNLSNDNTSCYLYFDKQNGITVNDIIAANTPKTESPDFSQVATEDEGVYAVEDGMYGGTSYYWRGAASTNYLKFAGFCWRIVRINGDGSIRMIYDGTSCHANGEVGQSETDSIAITNVKYNDNKDRSEYVGYTYTEGLQRPSDNAAGTPSNLKMQTDNWLNENITGINLTKIVEGKFCNDRDVKNGTIWASIPNYNIFYKAHNRINEVEPTLNCSLEDIYNLKIGNITIDEARFAGEIIGVNHNYYLYNNQNYWTMTPYHWDASKQTYMFVINKSSGFNGYQTNSICGIRPVINLRSDITISSGNGTIDSPYVVEGTE